MMKMKKFAHCIVQLVLFVIFWKIFGEPSYNDVMRQDMVMKESKATVNTFPAISICLVRFILIINEKFFFQKNRHRKKTYIE